MKKCEVLSGETVFLRIGPLFRRIGPRVSPDGTFSKTQRSYSNETPCMHVAFALDHARSSLAPLNKFMATHPGLNPNSPVICLFLPAVLVEAGTLVQTQQARRGFTPSTTRTEGRRPCVCRCAWESVVVGRWKPNYNGGAGGWTNSLILWVRASAFLFFVWLGKRSVLVSVCDKEHINSENIFTSVTLQQLHLCVS